MGSFLNWFELNLPIDIECNGDLSVENVDKIIILLYTIHQSTT